jgi:cell division protein FtsI (penicillin-binding protein 3)
VDAGSRPSQYLALARDLEVQDASRVMEVLTPHLEPGELNRGLMVRKVHFREYPRGALLGLGPVVGWVRMGQTDTEQVGASGLEYKLESYLSCLDGQRKVYCDAQRTTRFCGPESIDIAAIHGYTVHATIDSRVQRIAEEELQSQLTKMEAEAGVTIVMNCRNGDVLGMVSLPGFDPNRVGQYPPEELARRRKNRAVENEHEPGSTIKPFIVATALERGVVNRHETIWGGGKKTKILKRTVRDVHDHGPITVEDAVVFSSNIGAALIGLRLGAEGLNDALDLFHFQERSGIRLPGEARGRRESRRNWSDRFTSISVSFGYNVTMSPIQLAAAYCSLVNGGTYYRPRLVARLERDDEVLRVPTETLGQSVSPAVSATMREILHRVVEEGTGRFHKIDGLSYGGKTGTAAISKGKRGYAADGRKEYLSSYCAFAPYHGRDSIPEIVIIVMVEKSKKSYYGSTVCGPVVTGILKRLYGVDEMSHRVASSPQRKD